MPNTRATYNFLNLPRRIEKATEGNIKVRYTASGQKLSQKTEVYQLSPVPETEMIHYDGEISYENGTRIIYTSEGRVTSQADGDLQYEYTLRDHLGNTRVTFADLNTDGEIDPQREILQEAHYYPFGLQHYGPYQATHTDDNNYTYNGKETIRGLGLQWLDYGARWYDAAVARWWAVDPLAEKYAGWSGYNYVLGNPMIFIDPNGMQVDFGEGDKPKKYDGENNTEQPWDRQKGQKGEEPSNDGMSDKVRNRLKEIRPNWIGSNTLPVEKDGGEATQPVGKSLVNNLLTSFQDFVTVNNVSDFPISLKPEHGSTPISLAAHTPFFGEVDGIAAPHIIRGEVFKICNFNSATVTNKDISTTTVGTPLDRIRGTIAQSFQGGWSNSNKSYYNGDSNMPSSRCTLPCLRDLSDWKPLFDKSK